MEVATTTLWTFHQRLGVFLTILAAILSLAATVSVLAYAGFRSAKRRIDGWRGKGSPARLSEAVDSALFINLMLMDLLEALGVFPNIRWMNDAMITDGPLCKRQAAIKNFAGVGIAMASLAIAIHGFSIIVLDWKPRRHATTMIAAAVWIFTALIVIIPNELVPHGLYGPVGYWCWITTTHRWIQIFNHYLWMWLAGILMIIFYSIKFAVVSGWLIVENGKLHLHKNYTTPEHGREEESDEDREIKAIAKKMLFYPAVYIVLVFPYSLARWLYFSGHDPPYQFVLFTNTLYTLSGVFDVALFLATRPDIIRHDHISGTTNNLDTDPIRMTCTPQAKNLGKHGHLPTRHINEGTSSLPDLHHGWQGRDPEAPLTLGQDWGFQVECGRSSNRRHENPTSHPLQESSLYENHNERRGDLRLHSSSRQLGSETEVYGISMSSGGYEPPAGLRQPRMSALALTVVQEEDLGHLPR